MRKTQRTDEPMDAVQQSGVKMRRSVVACLLIPVLGCGALSKKKSETPSGEYYAIDSDSWVERSELPEAPKETTVRDTFAVSYGDVSPGSGVCLSEPLAYEYRNFRAGYKNLRSLYEADQLVWGAHRDVYETKIRAAEEALEEAQPSWWKRNDAQFVGVAGFIIGAATTIAISFAVKEESK